MPRRLDPDKVIATMRRAGVVPIEPFPGAKKKWRCRCLTCGEEVSPRWKSVQQGHRGCGYCTGHLLRPGVAKAAALAAGLEPIEPYPGANRPWRCRCKKCGAEVFPRYGRMQQGTAGCGYCSQVRVDPVAAVEAMRSVGLEPLVPYPGASVAWRCRCNVCGKKVSPHYTSIQSGGGGCAYCANNRVDPVEAEIRMRSVGLEPLVPYPGASVGWRCRCAVCGNEVNPHYSTIQSGGLGCGYCAHGSFAGVKTVIYVVVHLEFDAIKVGIARSGSPRIKRLGVRGWELVASWTVHDGADALAIEEAIHRWWRDELDAPNGLSQAEMGSLGGYTETAPLWAIDLDETIARIEQAIAGL